MTAKEVVIFDFGRVISAAKPPTLFAGYEKELGLAPGTINDLMFATPLWQEALLGELTMDQYWQRMGGSLGLSSPEAIRAFQRRYYDEEKINPEIPALLRSLAGSYRLAVLSNHPQGLQQWLADWQLDHFFELVICSGDVGMVKPDPAIFTLILERLEIAPKAAVFIDDCSEHVEAARRLRLRSILYHQGLCLRTELARVLSPF